MFNIPTQPPSTDIGGLPIVIGAILSIIGIVLGLLLYLIPTFIALIKKHPNKKTIVLINIFTGWTGIGWIAALVMAFMQPKESPGFERSLKQNRISTPNKAYEAPPQYRHSKVLQSPVPEKQAKAHVSTADPTRNYADRFYNDQTVNQQHQSDPKLIGVSGEYAGRAIFLDQDKVVIGRDPRISHLVYPHNKDDISRKHCIIQYDYSSQTFIIEDSSSNGTFLYPNSRLQHGQTARLKDGNRFYLVDPSEQFEVSNR